MGLLISWAALALGIWVASRVVSGFSVSGDWKSYVVVSAVFGVIHFFLGWLFHAVIVIGTLGVAYFLGFVTRAVVSAIVLKVADAVSDRLTIRGFMPALWAAIVLALTGMAVEFVVGGLRG